MPKVNLVRLFYQISHGNDCFFAPLRALGRSHSSSRSPGFYTQLGEEQWEPPAMRSEMLNTDPVYKPEREGCGRRLPRRIRERYEKWRGLAATLCNAYFFCLWKVEVAVLAVEVLIITGPFITISSIYVLLCDQVITARPWHTFFTNRFNHPPQFPKWIP